VPDIDKLNDDFERHVELRRRLSVSWNAFFARFGSLRPIQLAAIPPIVAGNNVLVTAPTAGGKTEAVVAPICERLRAGRWEGLSTLLITPTRALVNDLFERLTRPMSDLGIALGRKTADHAISRDDGREQFVVTTPESFESMLTFRKQKLANIRAIIIDEIHLLDGGPRGDQLRLLLQRLRLYLDHLSGGTRTLQIVALSATLPDARRTADTYLGPSAHIVSVSGQRDIEAQVIIANGNDRQCAEAAIIASEVFPDVRKALVFVNSRKQVDASAQHFRYGRFASASVHGHHGNLAKSQRENAEARFKSDRLSVCVATMTLEIGIDIGDVDLVICMDPPFALASFLQRIGRGCRRLQGKTRVLCVASSRARQLIFEGMIEHAKLGIPEGPGIPFRRSVLVQQTLAYLKQVDRNHRTNAQLQRTLTTDVRPSISASVLGAVLADMSSQGLLDRRNDVFQPASEGWTFIQSSRIYANIESQPSEIELLDVETGKLIATAKSFHSDDSTVRLAGKSYDIVGTEGNRVTLRGAGDATGTPKYQSKSLPYAFDVGIAVARRLGVPDNRIVAVIADDKVFVMTWIGMLNNAFLAEAARQDGLKCKPLPFGLCLPAAQSTSVQTVLQKCVARLADGGLAQQVPVERHADVGPYFQNLSDSVQKFARQDWLDHEFLKRWIDQITEVELVPLNSDLGQDILAVIKP
jgi:ATP-dependent Lhr-like helicase